MDLQTENVIRRQMFFWALAFVLVILFFWLFSNVLLPFIAGMVLAYFLDPVADLLERWGLSRMLATIVITVTFLVLFVLTLILVIPILASQIAGLIERMPELISKLQALVASKDNSWLKDNFGIDASSLHSYFNDLLTQGAGFLTKLLSGVWSSGLAIVNVVSLLVVTPVVAFYLLFDWDRRIRKIDDWLPRDHQQTIRQIFRDIDKAVAGFIRGQGSLCLVLGLFYGVALTIVGLNFGLLIGLFAGLISFIPYVGSTLGLVIALGVALVQFWPDYFSIASVVAIFIVGQFLEGNILQPKLVGGSIGLHPVWLMFSLFAFGSLFGFTGLLIAVPASAAIAVIVRFALGRYLDSAVYKGQAKGKKRVARAK